MAAPAKDTPAKGAAKPVLKTLNASAETGLMNIARERNLNVLIDSTRLAPNTRAEALDPAMRGPVTDVVSSVVFYTQEHHLSAQKLGPSTFVFWAEPDQDKLAQAVALGNGFGRERGEVSPDDLLEELRTQLDLENLQKQRAADQEANEHPIGWAGAKAMSLAPPPIVEGQLSALPVAVQQHLVALILDRSVSTNGEVRDYNELWSRDEIWQQARVRYIAADPRIGQVQTLGVQALAEDPQHQMALWFFPVAGNANVDIVNGQQAATPGLHEGQVRLLPTGAAFGAAQGVVVDVPLRALGTSLETLHRFQAGTLDLEVEASLLKPVSLDATRLSLSDFLNAAARSAGVKLIVSPQVQAASPLISAHINQMPLGEMLKATAHLYGAYWTKTEAQTFALVSRGLSPFEMELQQVGNFGWYRSRDIVKVSDEKRKEEFNGFAARVFDEAGASIAKEPGVSLASLSAETQQELRQTGTQTMSRRLIQRQVKARDLLKGNWSVRLMGRVVPFGRLNNPAWNNPVITILIDGKPAFNLSWLSERKSSLRTQNGKAITPADPEVK